MEDKHDIPDMNGTINDLLVIISGPLRTQKQNAEAIRNIAKVILHTYMLEKKILEELQTGSTAKRIFLDKVVPQLATFAILGLLWILFQNVKP